jgi:hypothetical protein
MRISKQKNHTKIAFCIPLFNEENSIPILKRNIKLVFRILPESTVFLNDNCSTDKTLEKILLIQKIWPNKIFIHRQSSNVGFSKNLAYFGRNEDYLKDKSKAKYFQFIGADDVISKKGLLHLHKQANNARKADIIISNWIYTLKKGERIKVLGDFDNRRRKVSNTLEDYLAKKCYIPGGIMQYCIHKNKLCKLQKYENEISPHVGVFFECLPGLVVCAGPPGLCLVRKDQKYGWRASFFGVVNTHVMCFEMYIRLIKNAYKKRLITKESWEIFMKQTTRNTWLIFKECQAGQWGKWAPTWSEKILIFSSVLKGLLRGSLFQIIANVRYLQKTIVKERVEIVRAFCLKTKNL